MKFLSWILAASFSLLLFGCSGMVNNESTSGKSVGGNDPLRLPATFTGELPCADCLRVELTLNLRPDSIYQLRKKYVSAKGSPKVESQLGYWRMAEQGGFIIFGKGKGALKSYEIIDENLLRFVSLEGVNEKSQIQYDLSRTEGYDLFQDSVKMRGMMIHESGKSRFVECKSDQSFPLDGGVEYRRMVQSFLNSDHGYGESVLVSLQGHLTTEADGSEKVSVDHFKKLYKALDCEGNRTRANLTETLWRLIEIGGNPVTIESSKKRPYFMLDSGDKKVNGSGSCNRLIGSYLTRGEVFLIKREHDTRMACTTGVGLESAFFKVLDITEKYRIEGDFLTLYKEDGTVLAVLQADY